MAKNDYSQRFEKFQEKVKNETVKIPLQKIVSLDESTKKTTPLDRTTTKPFNVWIPNDTLKALKIKAINQNTSIKNIINIAVEKLLNDN